MQGMVCPILEDQDLGEHPGSSARCLRNARPRSLSVDKGSAYDSSQRRWPLGSAVGPKTLVSLKMLTDSFNLASSLCLQKSSEPHARDG